MLDTNFWQDKDLSKKILKEKKYYEELINSYEKCLINMRDIEDLHKLSL